ncbi:hypothetical protein BLNAU_4425 [Blattamonas nauphoetae]|uniref:Uncharacterized protein n=1 Tax=Blattamonas nauphoetae TaxID=2049346 RepID=A0ABQ9Y9S8_9EUKA|nr:hypothetical protein BLNAU_4425 [Blattamonas nauphoetae]
MGGKEQRSRRDGKQRGEGLHVTINSRTSQSFNTTMFTLTSGNAVEEDMARRISNCGMLTATNLNTTQMERVFSFAKQVDALDRTKQTETKNVAQ